MYGRFKAPLRLPSRQRLGTRTQCASPRHHGGRESFSSPPFLFFTPSVSPAFVFSALSGGMEKGKHAVVTHERPGVCQQMEGLPPSLAALPDSPLGQNNLLSDQLVKLSGNTQMQPLGDKVGVKAGWSGASPQANSWEHKHGGGGGGGG